MKIQVHTRTVILALKDNITFLLDAETAEHGFIITADTSYLRQYSMARHNINANIKQLRLLVNDNPNQIQKLDTLDKFINQKLLFIDKLFSLKKQSNAPTINAMLVSNKSKYLMDNIRSANRTLQELEEKLFTERHSGTVKRIADAKNVFIIEFILSLMITIFLVFTVTTELTKRTNAEEQLNKNNIELKIKNRDLESKTNLIHENEKRIIRIMDVLIKTSRLDFSEKLAVSEARDELDAIALGLNTMSEEFEFHLNQLQQSEEKLNIAQRLSKIGNWEMDMATKKVHWSNEMFNIYGYGNERFEVSYEKALERMSPEDIEGTRGRMKKHIEGALLAFKEKGALEFESTPSTFTIVLPNSSKKVVQGIGKIVLDANGHVTKMVGTVQDITERYNAEQRLHQYNIELERKNKEIAQFAYAASHDLQEPLRSISNFSTLLAEKLEKYSDSEINKYMSLVSGGAIRMSKLIFDLLEYSRIGKDMVKSIKDCNLVVHEVLTDLASIIEESRAEIHIKTLPVTHLLLESPYSLHRCG